MNEKQKIALSNYEVNDILKDKTKILTYQYLNKIDNINELLEPYKNFILLYLSKPKFGHWVCVLKHPDRIEFFDPYGGTYEPDVELDEIDNHIKKITNQDFPYLSQLIYDSRYPVEFNNYQFQQYGDDIQTCGRHCIMRVLLKDLLLDDYYEFMNELSRKFNINFDQIVTIVSEYFRHNF